MNIVQFYKHEIQSMSGYWLRQIWSWDKLTLEQRHDYIQSLFPSFKTGTSTAYLLSPTVVDAFRTDPILQRNVLHSFNVMLNLYGLTTTLDGNTIIRITPINQVINGVTVGFYSTHNYLRITRILEFLRIIGQDGLARMFFLDGICNDLKNDRVLRTMVNKSGSLKIWMKAMGLSSDESESLKIWMNM